MLPNELNYFFFKSTNLKRHQLFGLKFIIFMKGSFSLQNGVGKRMKDLDDHYHLCYVIGKAGVPGTLEAPMS